MRTSVNLDSKSLEMLRILAKKKGISASEIVRRALKVYFELEGMDDATKELVKIYTDFLSAGEHCIVDIEHWAAIWEELNDKASEDFWDVIKRSGVEHGIQYADKGLKDVYSILRYMEAGNFFRIKVDGEGKYTLILSCPSEAKFLKVFLEGIFEGQGEEVEIRESYGKLRIQKLV
jgi:hypothetical protein